MRSPWNRSKGSSASDLERRLLNHRVRDLKRLDRQTRRRVVETVDRRLRAGRGDIAKLKGRPEQWRLRIGDWRVLYRHDFEARIIEIARVVHRGAAYR